MLLLLHGQAADSSSSRAAILLVAVWWCFTLVYILQGVTGFGSAILNLCTWIAFVVAGVQSGNESQAARVPCSDPCSCHSTILHNCKAQQRNLSSCQPALLAGPWLPHVVYMPAELVLIAAVSSYFTTHPATPTPTSTHTTLPPLVARHPAASCCV